MSVSHDQKRNRNANINKHNDQTKYFTPLCILFLQCCKIRRIARFSKLHFTSKHRELLGQYLQHPRIVKIGFCSLLGSTVNIVLQGQGYDLLRNLCNQGISQESPSP
jgi:hypothetical protein